MVDFKRPLACDRYFLDTDIGPLRQPQNTTAVICHVKVVSEEKTTHKLGR